MDIPHSYLLTIKRVLTNHRPSVDQPSTECRPITGRYIGQVSVKYRPIIGQLSAKCRRGIGDLKSYIGRHTSRPTIDRLSTECRPSVDRQSTKCRPTVDRVSIECRSSVDRVSTATSTDIAVDIAVDITYSKHDPRTAPLFTEITTIKLCGSSVFIDGHT